MPKNIERMTTPVRTLACEEPLRRIRASTTMLGIVWDAMRHGGNTTKEQAAEAIHELIEALRRDAEELSQVIWENEGEEFLRRIKENAA